MVFICSVSNCRNMGKDGIRIHKFPDDPPMILKWVKAIKKVQPSYVVTKSSKVCSSHFVSSDYNTTNTNAKSEKTDKKTKSNTKLKRCAVPSVFVPTERRSLTSGQRRRKQNKRQNSEDLDEDLPHNQLAETKALPNRQKRRQNMRRKTKDLSEDVPSDSTSDQLVSEECTDQVDLSDHSDRLTPQLTSIDFFPRRFLRCHSKTDLDSADISTQVWQAAFEPSKKSHFVATCGGNKVCVIDVKTGLVQYRYSWLKGLLYTLSWSTACPNNSILATAGTNSTIVFIDLSTKTAYLHYSLPSKKTVKVFISYILFHPCQRKLFCAQNDGHLYIFDFEIDNKRIVNLERQLVIDIDCEIFGLAICQQNDYLLIATNIGLMGWNNSQRLSQELLVFELPENPNNQYKKQNEKVIDSVEIIKDGWIATKVALHGVIYIFHLGTTLSKVENNKCVVNPTYVLKWSNTDNYFMSCGVGFEGNLLACGDDMGSIWVYNLRDMDLTYTGGDATVIEAHTILKWPKLRDSFLKKPKKLENDSHDIIIAKCAIHSSGKYLVAVTNNNFVCLYCNH